MRPYEDPPAGQDLLGDAAGDAEGGRQAAGEVATAPHVRLALPLHKRGVIRVAGPGLVPELRIVRGVLVAVLDHSTQRRTAGDTVFQPGEEGGAIRLLSKGGEGVFAGSAPVQKGLERIQVHCLAGGQAVHHHADGRPVGLAEDADLQQVSELRGHGCHLPIADIPPRKWGSTGRGGNGRRHDDPMVIGPVHGAAGEGAAGDGETVGPLFTAATQSCQHGADRGEPVALLHPEPPGVHKPGGAGADRSHHRQGRQQVRDVGDVDLQISGVGQTQVVGHHRHISLDGKRIEPLQFQLGPQRDGCVPEARLGPVSLHSPVKGSVGVGGDLEYAPMPGLRHCDACSRQGVQGHEDVVPALHSRGGNDLTGTLQQRQGKEQPGKKLTGDIAGEMVFSWRQSALYGENAVFLLVRDAFFPKQVKIGALGPLHQPPVTGKDAASRHRQGNGEEEAQGGAGLTAV